MIYLLDLFSKGHEILGVGSTWFLDICFSRAFFNPHPIPNPTA